MPCGFALRPLSLASQVSLCVSKTGDLLKTNNSIRKVFSGEVWQLVLPQTCHRQTSASDPHRSFDRKKPLKDASKFHPLRPFQSSTSFESDEVSSVWKMRGYDDGVRLGCNPCALPEWTYSTTLRSPPDVEHDLVVKQFRLS